MSAAGLKCDRLMVPICQIRLGLELMERRNVFQQLQHRREYVCVCVCVLMNCRRDRMTGRANGEKIFRSDQIHI